jgi:DNA-binding IclR family transcriptional regulator
MIDILAEEGDLSAAEIAARTGEPRSSMYRMLASLQRLGFVESSTVRGKFRLGTRLFRLGSTVAMRFDGRQEALPIMEWLHEETEHTVFYCVREDWEALCIERIDGRWVQSMALSVGSTLPLHVGGAGRALLAFSGRDEWEQCLARADVQGLPEAAVFEPDAILRELELTRQRGYSISDGDVVPGMAAIGAPVFDHRGRICASVSLSGVNPSILGDNEQRNVALVMQAAGEISRALGYLPPGPVDAQVGAAVDSAQLRALGLGSVMQVGIVVKSMDVALPRYSELFGLDRWAIYTCSPETVPEMSFRGRPAAFKMKLAFAGEAPQIELIEPLEGPSVYHEWMEEHGDGIHHVGVRVPSIDGAVHAMAKAGHEPVQTGRGYGLDGDGGFAYFDMRETLGFFVEAIELSAQRRLPEALYPGDQ